MFVKTFQKRMPELKLSPKMWEPEDQEYAIAFVCYFVRVYSICAQSVGQLVLSSVGGSVVGAVAGGFVEAYLSLQ